MDLSTEEVSIVEEVVTTKPATEGKLITLDRENFRKLHDSVKLIVDSNCTDCIIENGVIRQATNDRQSIISIDMSSIIPDLTMSLSNAKQKVGLMRIILNVDESVKLKDSNVYIQTLEKNFKLYDERWEYTLTKPMPELMDNKFIPTEVANRQTQRDDSNLILSTNIGIDIIRGVQANCDLFQNNMITFTLKGDKADIHMSENSNTNSGKIKSNIALNITGVKKSQFRLFSLPFKMDLNSNMQIDVYKQSDDNCLCVCELELDGCIPVTVYTKVKLIEVK